MRPEPPPPSEQEVRLNRALRGYLRGEGVCLPPCLFTRRREYEFRVVILKVRTTVGRHGARS